MDPITAGIMVGGSWLSQYMQQRAQEEAQRRQTMMDAAQTQGQQSNAAIQNWMKTMGQALL